MPKHLTTDDSATFVGVDQVGAADGVAGLDADGKVPDTQLPAAISNPVLLVNGHEGPEVTLTSSDVGALAPATADGRYLFQSSKGAADGVAGLDGSALVSVTQLPDLSTQYVAVSQIGANSGVAALDGSGKLTATAQVYSGSATAVAAASAAGVSDTAARGDHVHQGVGTAQNLDNVFAPGDQGMIAWSGDPAITGSTVQAASGSIRMMKIVLRRPATLSTVWMVVTTAGTTLTSGQNLLGLYTATGTRVAVTADQTTAWGTTGIKSAAFTSPYAAAAGSYYVAILGVGTAAPVFAANSLQSAGSAANANLSVSTGRSLVGPGSQTSLPASITMTSATLGTAMFWVGVS